MGLQITDPCTDKRHVLSILHYMVFRRRAAPLGMLNCRHLRLTGLPAWRRMPDAHARPVQTPLSQ